MMEKSFVDTAVSENLQYIEETIHTACAQASRKRDDVTLLAVTKTVPPERINAAIQLGIRTIGENRVQEFMDKQDSLLMDQADVHLIGHLQTNKVRRIVGNVQMIESVDSLRLATAISRCSQERGLVTPVLVEVNIGGEAAKSGVSPDMLEELLGNMHELRGLHVCGLMTVPPIFEKEREKRQVFSKMYQLFIDIRDKKLDNIDMQVLSMGMSGDYREAILEGATLVRIGSALFGKRQ